MAKGLYVGNSNAKKVKSLYVGTGTSRKVKKGYVGVNGKSRLFYSGGHLWKKYTATAGNSVCSSYTTMTSIRNYDSSISIYVSLQTGIGHDGISRTSDYTNYLNQIYLDSSGTLQYNYDPNTSRQWYTSKYIEIIGSRGNSYQSLVLSKFRNTIYTVDAFAPIDPESDNNYRDIAGSRSGDGDVYMLVVDQNGTSPSRYMRFAIYKLNFTTEYIQGEYISDVESNDQNDYPQNGIHTDGYWYVYQGEA